MYSLCAFVESDILISGFLPCYQKGSWVKQTPSLDEHGLSQVEPGEILTATFKRSINQSKKAPLPCISAEPFPPNESYSNSGISEYETILIIVVIIVLLQRLKVGINRTQ